MEFTRITNKFGNKFLVPTWKAEEMILNKEISIKDCETVEVETAKNTEKAQTKEQFEAVAPKGKLK
jgi:hypothetical protein